MASFLRRISDALDIIQTIPHLRDQVRSIESTISMFQWNIERILRENKKDEEKEPEKEFYAIGKDIVTLKEHLNSISFERLKYTIENQLQGTDTEKSEYLRIIYTCGESVPGLRNWILAEYKDLILSSFSHLATNNNGFVMNKEDVEKINKALQDELDQSVYISGIENSFLADFVETFQNEAEIQALKETPEFAEIIENTFLFDDIVLLDDRAVQLFLREIQSDSLILALKGSSEEIREKIFKNMSRRAAEMLREDLESRGPVRLSEVQNEQREIVSIIKRLADEGQLALLQKGDALV